jgi:hypothetical protein
MPKRLRTNKKQPTDTNQAAHEMVLRSTDQLTRSEISRFMAAMGSKGGKKGGKARAAKMTDEERSESASKAARAKWDKIRASKPTS